MPKERVRLTAIKVATDYLHHNRSTASVPAVTSQNPTITGELDVDTSSMTSSLSSCDVIQCDLAAVHAGNEMEASQTNLIVNYLPQTLTQEDMKCLFSSVGEMESCRLIRDKSTGQSLGYGFVKYKTIESANKAIATLNGLRIQNKTIKVSVARPSSDCIKGANLYVSGLPKHATGQDLINWFAPCGQIITARVLSDPLSGLTRGVGFVRFNLKSEAETAIKLLSGTVPNGATEPISVKFANQPTVAKTTVPNASTAAAAVCRLGLVPAHGQPAVGTLLLTPHNQLLPAPGAVQPRLTNLTQLPAMTSPAGYTTMPTVDPMLMASQYGCGSAATVVVNNMPNDLDEAGLCRLFQCFGNSILSACILGTQPPVGLVTLSNYYDALNAITSLNGLAVNGSVLQLALSPVAAPSPTGNTALTSVPAAAAAAATINTTGLRYLIPTATAAAAATTRQLIPLTII